MTEHPRDYPLPRAERRPELPEPLIVPDWTLVGIYAIAGLIVGIAGTIMYLRFW